MIPLHPSARRPATPPTVLVAEDDPRVCELLRIAFGAQHVRVVTAVDGDEAIRRALADRPDAVVLDVRLPRRGGLEVVDHLRADPDDPQVPIVLISGAAETDARLEGLAHGADDFVGKPFSPRELVARVQRLMARAGEAREQRRRGGELERELARAEGDARRAREALRLEQQQRRFAARLAGELHGGLDPDAVADRALRAAQRASGARSTLLLAAAAGGTLRPVAARGEPLERWAGLALPAAGEVAALLHGLARPVLRAELERFPALARELAPVVAAGVQVLVPVRGPGGLAAVIACDEPPDGGAPDAAGREALASVGELAGPAWRAATAFRAQQDHALALLAARAQARPAAARAAAEAQARLAGAAEALALPARLRALVAHALAFGAWGWGEEAARALAGLERDDPGERIRELRALIAAGESLDVDPLGPLESRRAAWLVAVGVRHQIGRLAGRSARESWRTALAWTAGALDPRTREALEAAPGSRLPDRAA